MTKLKRATAFLQILPFVLLLTLTQHSIAQPGTGTPTRNDHIFPSAAAAKPYVDFDARGFLINGKRTFIASAGMEYARVPRALWRDRLLKFKRAGFNAVEMYTFWNFHEPKEGQFNFTGDRDLNAFLQLIKSMGMYAIVRVGPYYCGEWSMGGYPVWLKFKPGLRVREDNPQFLSAVDKFFNKLIPIVAKNQINHGGSVIMVQLENEHRAGWGTVVPNNYFKHLQDKTIALGLQVPYFFSGLHSGNDPASDYQNLDDPDRPNPWFAPEYWAGWITNYGPQEGDSTRYERSTWKMIAHGAGGYNVYMAHGGTNFDYYGDRETAASYDYGAAIGQAGDLRPLYFSFKRANWFARTFETILANSVNEEYHRLTISDTSIKATTRKSPNGSIVFLDNPDSVSHKFKVRTHEDGDLNANTEFELAAGQITPIIQSFNISKNVYLAWSPAYIYNIIRHGKTTTFLVQGKSGSTADMYFSRGLRAVKASGPFFKVDDIYVRFKSANISATSPSDYTFTVGDERVKIVVVSDDLAKRSWLIENKGQTDLVIGPEYAGKSSVKNGTAILTTERPWLEKANFPVLIYGSGGDITKIKAQPLVTKHDKIIKPSNWRVKEASKSSLPNFDDSKWLTSQQPLQMGADGDITSNAWYRTKIKVNETGSYLLQFTRGRQTDTLQHAAIFLDGRRIDTSEYFDRSISLDLKANTTHSLSIFVSHAGRNKLIFKLGVIDTLDTKGIFGPVTLQKIGGVSTSIPVGNWRMEGGPGNPFETVGWKPVTSNQARSPKFYRATLNLPAVIGSNIMWRVNTTSLSRGSVWVNGHNLGVYPEKIKIWGLYIPDCWLKPGKNELVIFDENGVVPDKVRVQAEVEASRDTRILQFKTKLLQ